MEKFSGSRRGAEEAMSVIGLAVDILARVKVASSSSYKTDHSI